MKTYLTDKELQDLWSLANSRAAKVEVKKLQLKKLLMDHANLWKITGEIPCQA